MTDLRILLLACLAMIVSAPALALDAETADLVSGYTIQVPRSFAIDEDDGTVFVGVNECESMLADARISVAFQTTFNPQVERTLFEELDVFAVERDSSARIDCITGELCIPIDQDDYDFTTTGVVVDIAFSEILAAGEITSCEPFDKEFFVRLIVERGAGSDTTENADAKIVVDTTRPASPSNLTAVATENTIKVDFEPSPDSDINRYFVYWSSSPFDGGVDPDSLTLERRPIGEESSATVSVTLDPTREVYVAIAAEDMAGNLSSLSGVAQATVVETNDFWEQYRQAGGDEDGGCATTTAHPSPWLLVFGVVLAATRRRRRFAITAALVAILLTAPLSASAESPTFGAFELKFGGYYPAIDDEFGGSGPFADVFGTKNLLLGEIEVDGWLWQGFGKLGIGGHIAYTRVKGGAVPTEETSGEAEGIEDTTAFSLIPMRLSLIYRFDWLAQHTAIPLAASIKVGPDFYRWRITNANGETATFDGDPGSGWKKGWHVAAGLQLLLDFIDPATAAAFDLSWGINNSYLFVEYMVTRIDDFGAAGFDLSDNMWLFGLSFEF